MNHSILRERPIAFFISVILSSLLATVSALLSIAIGPALYLMLGGGVGRTETVPMASLVGDWWSKVFSWYFSVESVQLDQLWLYIPVFLVFVAFFKFAFSVSQGLVWEWACESSIFKLRNAFMSAYLRSDPHLRQRADFSKAESNLVALIQNDLRLMRDYWVHFYGSMPRECIQIAILLTTMFTLSVEMSSIFLAAVLPAGVFLQRVGRKLRRRAGSVLADYSELAEWIQQRFLGIETIKHYQSESLEVGQLRGLIGRLNRLTIKAARTKALSGPGLEFFSTIAIVLVFWFALRAIGRNEISGSILMSFFGTVAMLGQSAGKLGKYLNMNREGSAAWQRFSDHSKNILQCELSDVRKGLSVGGNTIRFVDASMRYEGSSAGALNGVNLTLEHGKIYALCGKSGAGKSSLARCLLGISRLSSGTISLSKQTAENGVGYLPQKPLLFTGTIAENVSYPMPPEDEKKIQLSLELVGLRDWITTLPEGLKTKVDVEHAVVSGGQAQRILLSRLFYHKFAAVVIDEGTSAADSETEERVLASIRELASRGTLVLMIAHRRAAAMAADEIIVMDRGAVVAKGLPHDISRSNEFAKLFQTATTASA